MPNKNLYLKVSLFFSSLFLAIFTIGCGDDVNLDSLTEDSSERAVAAAGEASAESALTADTITADTDDFDDATAAAAPLVRSTQFFGQSGNLYKPESDATSFGAGNLVVLFSSAFTRQFESCSIIGSDGTSRQLNCIDDQPFTQIPFSCFSNGNRQTWRANFRCESVGAIVVTCLDFNQEITFTVPEDQQGNVCSRFG